MESLVSLVLQDSRDSKETGEILVYLDRGDCLESQVMDSQVCQARRVSPVVVVVGMGKVPPDLQDQQDLLDSRAYQDS